jgi:4-amino-4-deoxy-L-arabinose transferase-like glycosyltransferase
MPAQWSREAGTGGLTTYEAFQPPLYYWMMAPVLRLMSGRSLAEQVMALRWLGSLIASLAIPLIFGIGREVFRDDARALGCAAVVAVMPSLP